MLCERELPIGMGRLCIFHDFRAFFFIHRLLWMRAEAVSTSWLTRWRPINEQSFVLNYDVIKKNVQKSRKAHNAGDRE